MEIQEKLELCGKALIMWNMEEQQQKNMSKHNEDVADMFISKILLKKFEVFKIDIVLPDMLLLILDLCVNSNPGQVQILLKDLLNGIKERRNTPIPKGYVIKAMDFAMQYPTQFPIMDIPEVSKKFEKMWDDQKYVDMEIHMGGNACDTPEWWLEVMK